MRPLMAVPALIGLLACAPDRPENKIKKAFDACVTSVEKGDAGGVIQHVDKDFRGPEGMDRDQARLFLMGLFRQTKVGVTVLTSTIQVKGNNATQVVEVFLTGRSGGNLLPDENSRKTFRLSWRQRDADWMLREISEG